MANAELVARMTEGASAKPKQGSLLQENEEFNPKLEDQVQEGKELLDEFAKKIEGDDDDLPF